MAKLSKFGAAFAAARKAGKATFTFGGKAYTTKLREEVNTPTPPPKPQAPAAPVPVPAPQPKTPAPPTPTEKANAAVTSSLKVADMAADIAAKNRAVGKANAAPRKPKYTTGGASK